MSFDNIDFKERACRLIEWEVESLTNLFLDMMSYVHVSYLLPRADLPYCNYAICCRALFTNARTKEK